MNRLILSVLFAACQVAAAAARNAGPCLAPHEKAAFEIVALKTTLMVAALSCGESHAYNDMMTRFLPFMRAQQAAVDGYFQRVNGPDGRAREDGFMTQLANDASQEGAGLGDGYCGGAAALFDAVLSLPDQAALQALADREAPAQGGPASCGMRVAAAAPAPGAESREDHAVPRPVITGWAPPAPLAAVKLPGSSPLAAGRQAAPRKPVHGLYAAARRATSAAKPVAKPVLAVVQI